MVTLAEAPSYKVNIDNKEVLIKDPTDYLIESLNLPELPEKHFEFLEIIVAGDMGSGKSYFINNELAPIAKDIWTEYIDFFDAKDISGTIKGVLESDKLVHFIKIDDAIRKGSEGRRAMSTKNVSATQKFFIIRHLAKKGKLGAGYIILVFATQDIKALDLRIRNHAGIVILKSFVHGCKKLIKDEDILNRLYYLADNARRRHRNDIRRIAITVDARPNSCHQILTRLPQHNLSFEDLPRDDTGHIDWEAVKDIEELAGEKIEWKKVPANTTLKKHMNELVTFTYNVYKHYKEQDTDLNNQELKGFMLDKLEQMEEEKHYCEVSDAHFLEAIYRAKKRYIQYEEQLRKEEEKQKQEQKKKEKALQRKLARKRDQQINQLAVIGYSELRKFEEHNITLTKSALRTKIKSQLYKIKDCILEEEDVTEALSKAEVLLKNKELKTELRKETLIEKHGFDPNNDEPTHFEVIYNAMKREKIADISILTQRTGLEASQISPVLSRHTDTFINVLKNKGVWKLKGYKHSQLEIQKFIPNQQERKVLEM
ncbi:MAG: hypothetical protein ACOC4M_04550 [Promethearchaeia archaeon]